LFGDGQLIKSFNGFASEESLHVLTNLQLKEGWLQRILWRVLWMVN